MAPPAGDFPPVLIVNPVSGGQRFAERWLDVERLLVQRVRHYQVQRTRSAGEVTALAREALDAGAPLVISVGGDGTHTEVARAFFDEAGRPIQRYADRTLGILPLGRGNDLARSLGLPRKIERALGVLGHPPRAIDVLWLRTGGAGGAPRLVLNALSIGVSAAAVALANRLPTCLGGRVAYALAGLRAVFGAPRVALDVVCGPGGPRYPMAPLLLAVCNGSTFGGGIRVAPLARPDDGVLEIIAIARGLVGALALAPRLLIGRHLGRPGVTGFSCPGITIEAGQGEGRGACRLECDGEDLGEVTLPITVEVAPGALRIAGA